MVPRITHDNIRAREWRMQFTEVNVIFYMIYSLTAIGLAAGGSSTVHIYLQTIHRTTQWKQNIQNRTQIKIRIHKHNNKNT